MEYLKRRHKMPKKKTDSVEEEIKKIVKKKKRKVYFGQEVQNAIIDFNFL